MNQNQAKSLLDIYLASDNRKVEFVGTKGVNIFTISIPEQSYVFNLKYYIDESECGFDVTHYTGDEAEFDSHFYNISYQEYSRVRQLCINQILL